MKSRNLWLLAMSQVFGGLGAPLLVLVGGIIGADLAPTPTLATLPVSLMVVGVALATIPVALVLQRLGRRTGYQIGAGIGVLAAILGAVALANRSFGMFCLAAFLIGVNNGFILQYRFGAAESVSPDRAGQAVSVVLMGGMISGYLGPEIARRTRDLLDWGDFSASFLILAVMYAVVIGLLVFAVETPPADSSNEESERPMGAIVIQPAYVSAVLSGAVAFGVMSLIMTATPVQMHSLHDFTLADTAWVIQSHIIAMYLPSLFSAFLFARLGVHRVMLIGTLCLLGCVGLGIYSQTLLEYWTALVLLGVGWNFLFVGATVQLTRTYRPAERFRAQAVNDFTIFAIQAVASLSAGTVIFRANWSTLLLLALPPLIALFAMQIALHRHSPQTAPG